MSDVCGCTPKDIKTLRTGNYPYIRAMIAQTMRDLGYTYTQIGRVLGRTYSAILIAVNKLESNIENPTYKDVNKIYKEYKAKVKEYKSYLYGTTTQKCIWDVPEEKRICIYCKRPNCAERKYAAKNNEPESFG